MQMVLRAETRSGSSPARAKPSSCRPTRTPRGRRPPTCSARPFRSPANARRLFDAYDRARTGETRVRELDRSDGDA